VGRRRLAPLAVVALSVWARAAGFYPKGPLISRCDGFALGGLLAGLLDDRERVARHARRFGALFAALGAVAVTYPVWGRLPLRRLWHAPDPTVVSFSLFFMTVLYFCLVGTAVVFAGRPALAPLRDRRLAYLGQISNGLNLYHPLVYLAVDAAGERLGLGRSLGLDRLKLAGTFAVAAWSWRSVERPILALKDRYGYRPLPSHVAPEASPAA
jgi:peptidoglycan/LPS O-acetylase OafA/YrhL